MTMMARGRLPFPSRVGAGAIAPEGSCSGSVCVASAGGSHTVTGSSGGTTGTASLAVTASFVKNPGFEVDTSGWNTSGSATGVTLTRVAGVVVKLRFREYSGATLVGTGMTQMTLTTGWQQLTLTYSTVSPLDLQRLRLKRGGGHVPLRRRNLP